MNITEMCKQAGITRTTYYSRIKRGMSVEEALNTPPTSRELLRRPSYVYLYKGEWLALQEIMSLENITYSQAYCRYVVNNKRKLERKETR